MRKGRQTLILGHDNSPLSNTDRRRRTKEPQPLTAQTDTHHCETLGQGITGLGGTDASVRPPRLVQSEHRRPLGTTPGQVFWLPDQSTNRAFPSFVLSGGCGVRPRLQRRDRDGFAPSSLFSRAGHKPDEHPCRPSILPPCPPISTVRFLICCACHQRTGFVFSPSRSIIAALYP